MRKLRDFQCPHCEKTYERLVSDEVESVVCDCGGLAIRIIGLPTVMLDGTDPSFPGAYDKWARTREQRAVQQKKKSYYQS